MGTTVQHEKGKADVIADTASGSVRQVPEGTGEKEAGLPEPSKTDEPGGFINGHPATKEEVRKSTEVR